MEKQSNKSLSTLLILGAIAVAEVGGQLYMEQQFDEQIVTLKAQYQYRQQFYQNQLNALSEGLAILSRIKRKSNLIKVGKNTGALTEAASKWDGWVQNNQLYLSSKAMEMAGEVWLATMRRTVQIENDDYQIPDQEKSLDAAIAQIQKRLVDEAQRPSEYLGGIDD